VHGDRSVFVSRSNTATFRMKPLDKGVVQRFVDSCGQHVGIVVIERTLWCVIGLTTNLIRAGPNTATQFMAYETLRDLLGLGHL
jgi:hypothetical protein